VVTLTRAGVVGPRLVLSPTPASAIPPTTSID
jgi:hypothetical protein